MAKRLSFRFLPASPSSLAAIALCIPGADPAAAQPTTQGFVSIARTEPPGTLISRPFHVDDLPSNGNDSRSLGRTVTLSYLNGWLVVGGESPGSADGSDLSLRVYDLSDPEQLVRLRPSHFGHAYTGLANQDEHYPDDFWFVGSAGWNAHGTAFHGPYLLPLPVLRVASHGGPVELGGRGGVPGLREFPLLYNRASMAGPWSASMLWYGGVDQLDPQGRTAIWQPAYDGGGLVVAPGRLLASFDHVGTFGGGDWHPIFFGDLLIYARSGASGRDGIVVYRLAYHDHDDDGDLDAITPGIVGSLQGGFEGYWPNLFSDGTGLHVIGSATDILTSADITAAADPAGDGSVRQGPVLAIPGFSNASYPVYQDGHAFIHNRKIAMTPYLAGQGNASIVLTLDEAGTGVDTTQMSLPLGNLWVTGGYPNAGRAQGMAIWVHQQAPDTTRPRVAYHVPQSNRGDYPRFAPLSFLVHEQPRHGGMRNGVDFAVRRVLPGETLGDPVEGFLIHDFAGVVTFTPDSPLDAAATYQVDFFSDLSAPSAPIGFVDVAGNPIEPYSFRFSTGDTVAAVPPPTVDSFTADDYQPAPGQAVNVAVVASGTGTVEARFSFDGTWPAAWSETLAASHAYATPGRHRVLAQVRDSGGGVVTRSLDLLVIAAPPAGPGPTRSSTVVVSDDGPLGRRAWVVNPDADTVAAFDLADGTGVVEFAVGDDPRSIARDAFGRLWVTCQGSDELRVLNADGTPHAVVPLAYGSAPFGIAPSPDGQHLYVTLQGSSRLLRFAAANPVGAPLAADTFPTPRAIAVSPDGSRVLVTRFLSPALEGEVAEFTATLAPVRTFRLASANTIDNGDRAAGVPNHLAGIAISPDGRRAAVVSKQDNVHRGPTFGVAAPTFETTVRAVVSFLDLEANVEIRHARRDFDNSEGPSAVTYTPLGDTILVTLQGNHRLVGFDALSLGPIPGIAVAGSTLTSPVVKTLEAPTGLVPQGLAVDPTSGRIVVQDFLGRTATLLDASAFLSENRPVLVTLSAPFTVALEPLLPEVLLGKRIFHDASDPRMGAQGYLSCASCHADGGHDGRTWDFGSRGEGLRRTTDLRGRAGTGHGNVHWSGNFDEIQDFEHDMRGAFGGTGFLPLSPAAFEAQHPSPATPKAGLSPELDALAAYLGSLAQDSVPRSPHRGPDGALTEAALRGREIFAAQACTDCHGGDAFTDSAVAPLDSALLRDVGTLTALSGGRLGGPLAGIDTPSLVGLHATNTYLHDGRASTLAEVFSTTGGTLRGAGSAIAVGASVSLQSESPAEGGGGFARNVVGGTFAEIGGTGGSGLRFEGIDGGPAGGPARLGIRHILRGTGTTIVRVNGVESVVQLLPQAPDNAWMTSGWRWVQVDITLQPGPANVIEVLRGPAQYANFQLNAIVVSNAEDLEAALPHRRVLSLSSSDRSDLFTYLRSLDGSPGEAPPPPLPDAPVATFALAGGADPGAPWLDLVVEFSVPVSGLALGDFLFGGSAAPSHASLVEIEPGTRYALRLAGFTGSGTVTVSLPAGSVVSQVGGVASNAVAPVEFTHAPPAHDPLQRLSDEFDDAGRVVRWSLVQEVEGWEAEKLETWDVDTSAPGRMRLVPRSGSWYQDFVGACVFREVTGDFVVSTALEVRDREGTGRPQSDFSLAGLMVRSPRAVSAAAPSPAQPPESMLAWPPPAPGQPGHYATDWTPGGEDYVFLSWGFGSATLASPDGGNPSRWQYEVKSTDDGVSTLYPRTHGVPVDEPRATLQIVRRGSTFLLLRRHGDGPWIVENRFERPDLPATLQVGIAAYTDWTTVSAGWDFSPTSVAIPYHQNRRSNVGVGNPDLVADVDWFRVRRPPTALTASLLQSAPVTGPGAFEGVVALAGTALAGLLGDAAAGPAEPQPIRFAQWLGTALDPALLADPAATATVADPLRSGMPNLLHFVLGGFPATRPGLGEVEVVPGDPRLRYLLPLNPEARGWRVIVETTSDFVTWTPVAESLDGATPTGSGVEGEIPSDPPVTVIGPGPVGADTSPRFYRTRVVAVPPP